MNQQADEFNLDDISLPICESKTSQKNYVIYSLRFDSQKPVEDFKKITKDLGVRTNQEAFEYLIRCTRYVMEQLEKRGE
jgi:hypothetical protein